MDGLNETYNTTGNDTIVTDQPKVYLNLGVPGYLVSALTLLLVSTAWFLNIIVMRAINKADEEKLKVKFLLKNAIVGDMMLALSLGTRVVFQLAEADKRNTSLANLCATVAYELFSYFAAFYQIFASMAVAFDRFYSILQPLSYHTMKYSALVKTVIFIVLLGLTFGISIPMFLVKLEPGDPMIMACYRAFERSGYTGEVLPFAIVCSVFFTMGTYCSIFAIILYYRRNKRDSLGQQQSENQSARKRQTSLALTFFLIHITYVLMYLPGALYHSVLSRGLRSQPYLDYYLGQSTIIIYLANTIVDPVIYVIRIRSIKENLPEWWSCCATKSTKKGKDEKSGATATSSVVNSVTG